MLVFRKPTMISLQQVAVALFLVLVGYAVRWWLRVLNRRKQIECWLPVAPRIPVLGAVNQFGNHAQILNDITRLLNNPSKFSYIEMAGTSVIMSRNYDFLEFVLTSNKILRKSPSLYGYMKPWLGNGLLTSIGQHWKLHRRVITPAFHFSILEQFVDVFDSNGNVLIEKLKREALGKESLDIYGYINICTLDIICETAMGVNIGAQKNNNTDYVRAVKSMCNIIMTRLFSPSFKGNEVLFKFTEDYKKQCADLKILHGFTNSVIEKRKKELEATKTKQKEDDLGRKRKVAFLDLLLTSLIDGKPLTQEEIREEVDTFMFGGHDTTSSAISSALYVLAHHAEIQQLVRDELKGIYGKDRDRATTYQDLQDMKYLDLVIKEVLRLYPPAPMISRYADEDIEYKGHIIPKDTVLSMFIYGINRDPDYFDEPESFKPERFLETGGKNPFSYIPFSAGPRNCIGQKFAILEMKSLISKMLTHFEIRPSNPPHDRLMSVEVVLTSLNGTHVKLQQCQWEE